ncbi:MAG: sugar phosphate isomerase/epimerase family protein [Planctomycetota bacterium]
MPDITIGAQMYTLRDYCQDPDGVRESLAKVADIGYSAIQISGFGEVDMGEVAEICEEYELDVAATHEGWGRFKNELDELIEEHKTLGCSHPAIGGLPGEYHCAEGVQQFIDELGPIAEKLRSEGMDFSYHNHNHELVHYDGKPWLERLYTHAPAKLLKAEIDTYWIQAGGGDPAAWIRWCGGREPLVHFKDMAVGEEREPRFAPIGEGNLNWDAIIEACRMGGVEYALVEQDQCYDMDPFEALEISYNNLQDMGLE